MTFRLLLKCYPVAADVKSRLRRHPHSYRIRIVLLDIKGGIRNVSKSPGMRYISLIRSIILAAGPKLIWSDVASNRFACNCKFGLELPKENLRRS